METLWLHIRAPFASFPNLRTGTYRDTMPIMPPSAAYGLILNLAGIEMRMRYSEFLDRQQTATTIDAIRR